MSMKAVKPTDDCFGPWVTESAHELVNFGWDVTHDFRKVTFSETETAAYDVVDLMFRNDEYCHFRQTFWDVYDFCSQEDHCTSILANVQTNAFSLITQVSSTLAAFQTKKWAEMGREQKGYVLNTVGKAVTQIVADVIGFENL